MNIKDLLERVDYCFTSGGKYQWNCYGDDAYFLDFKNVQGKACGGAVVNSIGEVLETHVEVAGEPLCYQWFDKAYREDYLEEARRKNVNPSIAWDSVEFTNLEVEEDFLEKFDAIVHCKEFDRSILIPLNLPDDELLVIFKLAHEAKMTFNDYVIQLLTQEMDRMKDLPKKRQTYKEKYGW